MTLDLPDVTNLTVGFDTEASGLFVDEGARVAIVSVAWYDDDKIVSHAFPFDQGALDKLDAGAGASLFDDAPNLDVEDWDTLCAWLNQQNLICFNAKYDLHIMRAGHRIWGRGIDLSNRVQWDGMVINPLVWPGNPVGLKATFERLFGEKELETQQALAKWLKKNKVHGVPRYDLAPWDLVGPYATDDAEKHLRLWSEQWRWINEGEVAEPYEVLDREIDLALCLYRMECRGVGFDVEASRAAASRITAGIEALRRHLVIEWRRAVTPAAARWYFYDKLGIKPEVFSDNNTPSVDKEAMAGLVARQIPLAKEYQQFAQWKRAVDMYYEGWPKLAGSDNRLRPSYHQTKAEGVQGRGRGTISGRLSVERIQLQAIPHEYRHELPDGVP